jgi:hypothetical protein
VAIFAAIEKQRLFMKLKIIAIGIVALLLLTALPLIATAAPPLAPKTKTTLKDTVYLVEYVPYQDYRVVGTAGHVIVHVSASSCNIVCKGLVPGWTYIVGITDMHPAPGYVAGTVVLNTVRADAHRHILLRNVNIPSYGLDYYLGGGYEFTATKTEN